MNSVSRTRPWPSSAAVWAPSFSTTDGFRILQSNSSSPKHIRVKPRAGLSTCVDEHVCEGTALSAPRVVIFLFFVQITSNTEHQDRTAYHRLLLFLNVVIRLELAKANKAARFNLSPVCKCKRSRRRNGYSETMFGYWKSFSQQKPLFLVTWECLGSAQDINRSICYRVVLFFRV